MDRAQSQPCMITHLRISRVSIAAMFGQHSLCRVAGAVGVRHVIASTSVRLTKSDGDPSGGGIRPACASGEAAAHTHRLSCSCWESAGMDTSTTQHLPRKGQYARESAHHNIPYLFVIIFNCYSNTNDDRCRGTVVPRRDGSCVH